MSDLKLKTVVLAALLLLVSILLAACDDGDTDAGAGLTREEVQEIVRSEVASVAAPGPTGLTRAEVEEAMQAAIAGMPKPDVGLTADEARETGPVRGGHRSSQNVSCRVLQVLR